MSNLAKITVDTSEVEKMVNDAVVSHISEKVSYSTALRDMVEEALNNNRDVIQETLNETLKGVIANPDFKKTIKEEFQRKVAKSLVGNLEGAVEKAANVYRSDPTLKSRMILAIESMIGEHND